MTRQVIPEPENNHAGMNTYGTVGMNYLTVYHGVMPNRLTRFFKEETGYLDWWYELSLIHI